MAKRKHMKPIIIAALALLATAAHAQERPSPEQRAKVHTERMAKQLELSTEQSAQVEALNLTLAREIEARRVAREAEKEARKAEAKALRDAHDAEMKAVLNSDQYARWLTMREEALQKHKQRREERHEGK